MSAAVVMASMEGRVTLQTIADVVGVGKMTVSNAYSRPGHVSAALRERIFRVADELGYAGPDASGRALARRRTGLVGVLLTSAPEEAFENLGLPRELDHADAVGLGGRLLAGPDRPTAILCFSDLIARGVLDAASAAGLAVPQDVTVVGFDDDPLAAVARPALTTVRQDLGAKGRAAADALFDAMDAAPSGTRGRLRHTRLETELVVRDSSAPPPAGSRAR